MLSDEQIDQLSGRELDEAVATALGETGRREAMSSKDGGKSLNASTLDRSCWPTVDSLREWLHEQQVRGYLKDHKIIEFIQYTRRHDDLGVAMALLLSLECVVIGCDAESLTITDDADFVLATGPKIDASVLICRAWLCGGFPSAREYAPDRDHRSHAGCLRLQRGGDGCGGFPPHLPPAQAGPEQSGLRAVLELCQPDVEPAWAQHCGYPRQGERLGIGRW